MKPERTSDGVNEELDIFGGVLGVQQEQLADSGVGYEVINITPQEDDPLPEKQAHGVGFGASHGSGRRLRSRGQQRRRAVGFGGGFWGCRGGCLKTFGNASSGPGRRIYGDVVAGGGRGSEARRVTEFER